MEGTATPTPKAMVCGKELVSVREGGVAKAGGLRSQRHKLEVEARVL